MCCDVMLDGKDGRGGVFTGSGSTHNDGYTLF